MREASEDFNFSWDSYSIIIVMANCIQLPQQRVDIHNSHTSFLHVHFVQVSIYLAHHECFGSINIIIIIISFYSYTVHLHKKKYTGIVFWSIFTVYLRNLHIHIHHLPDLKE